MVIKVLKKTNPKKNFFISPWNAYIIIPLKLKTKKINAHIRY